MVTLKVSPRLTDDGSHSAIAATHLGQAHIAGTGPTGATCSQCAFWHLWKRVKINGEVQQTPIEPGRYSARHKENPAGRKDALCNKPMLNKSNRKVPPHAPACRFFTPRNSESGKAENHDQH